MDQVTAADSEPAAPPAGAIAAEQIWKVAQEELRFQLSRPGYETWLANATLVGYDGHTFTIGVPTLLARSWLTERYVPLIRETLSGVLGGDCEVEVMVDPNTTPPADEPAPPAEYDSALTAAVDVDSDPT